MLFTTENALKKKFDWRKIFKEVAFKCLEEAKDIMEKEVTEERLDMLNSDHEILKKKLSAIKILEDQIHLSRIRWRNVYVYMKGRPVLTKIAFWL